MGTAKVTSGIEDDFGDVYQREEFGFEDENYDYLICSHWIRNLQSQRVIEKSGFQFIKEAMRKTLNGEERLVKYYVSEKPKKRQSATL